MTTTVVAEGIGPDGPWRVERFTTEAVVLITPGREPIPVLPVVSAGVVQFSDPEGTSYFRGVDHLRRSADEMDTEDYPDVAAYYRAIADLAAEAS